MNGETPFGRYELIDRISAGGMAEVFRARDAENGNAIVALKKILPHAAKDEEFIEMFSDEARIASSLDHPHIARTLDFGTIASTHYIAFEYVRGKDLRSVFDRAVKLDETIPLPVLLHAFARVSEGLRYAHSRKDSAGKPAPIVHRDVSPQNILVSFDGDVKLIDFGIAKAAGRASRTAIGAIKGNFGYMSPEQVRGLEVDPRTDLFSLGITMWELLTRKRLFAAENELLVLEKIRNYVVAPPSTIEPSLPKTLDMIVLRALAKERDERYQSAEELCRDLDSLAQRTGKSAAQADVAAYMRAAFEDPPRPTADSSSGLRAAPPARSRPSGAGLSYNAENSMAADKSPAEGAGANEKKSDLDIFEGLGKKSAPPPRSSSAAPPAPPMSRSAPPPPPSSLGEVGKKTLLGIAGPAQGGPPSSRPLPSAPPPQRASLPAVAPPPQKSRSSSVPPPPPAPTKPAPYVAAAAAGAASAPAAGGIDMDWDDDDEATHIFDKEGEGSQAGPAPSAPKPAAGIPSGPPTAPLPRTSSPPAPPRPPNSMAGSAPPPPPGRPSAAPPPPPSGVGSSFARASGQIAAPGAPLGAPSAPSLAGQVHTEPMKMPSRSPSAAPPPPPGTMPGGFGLGRPVQQGNAFLQHSGQSAAPMPVSPSSRPLPMPISQPPQAPRAMEATALVRPPPPSKMGPMLAMAGALFIVGAVAVWFFVVPHSGNLAVNVTDAKGGALGRVEVYLDGRKVCDTAPCRIDQIKAGSHELKVMADGFEQPAPKLVAVESGKDVQEDFKLSAVAAKGTGFKVTGTQPGVKLIVDDKEIGVLPQELRDLEPGAHKIKLVGTLKSAKGEDRYAPLEQSITVQKDEMQDLGSKTLKVIIGKATITLGTAAAAVKLVSSSGDQRTPTSFPVSIEIDTSKASWTIEATKFGLSPYNQPISFDDGQAEKVYNVLLEPKSATPAPTVAYHPPTGGGGGATTTSGGGGSTSSSGGGGGAATGGAHLTINAIPVSGTVAILDGKPIGAVPKKDYPVSPGSHTIVFVNPGKSLRKSITVNVGDGESKPAFTKLDE